MATNEIDKMISWSNTLAYLVAELNKNNIPFKQSKMFKDTNAKWDSPLAMSDLAVLEIYQMINQSNSTVEESISIK